MHGKLSNSIYRIDFAGSGYEVEFDRIGGPMTIVELAGNFRIHVWHSGLPQSSIVRGVIHVATGFRDECNLRS
jgi:hypothetical protein